MNKLSFQLSIKSRMKTFKLTIAVVAITLLVGVVGLCAWLYQPFDKTAWRVKINLPVLGSVQVRAFALMQLATSTLGRTLFNNTQWNSKLGVIKLTDTTQFMALNCLKCHFSLKDLSPKAVEMDAINLTVNLHQHHLSGTLTTQSNGHTSRILYAGLVQMDGLDLRWSLPNSAIADLLAPLKSHSDIIQKAQVSGTLSADGTLHWPSRIWSANPVIKDFNVTGLNTEKLNSEQFEYVCPAPSKQYAKNVISSEAWQDKEQLGRWLPMAVIIAEDAQFMHHPGYNINTLRHLLSQEVANKRLGGSTITQQLAKYLFTDGERLWKRKIEELLYAVEMEKTLGKQRILNLYLNTVDWAPATCGAFEAAKLYFAVKPEDLSPIQAAWLAGILNKPHQAWQEQFKKNNPNISRVQEITRFMPAKVREMPIALNFAAAN
jgi:hypothetical protein